MIPLIDGDILREIEGQPGYYIDRMGQLYSAISGRYLKGYVGPNGYLYYTFKNKVREYAHRLVAKAFVPNPEGKPEVNHKNFVRLCNFDTNLEWVTTKENLEHAYTKENRKRSGSYKHSNCKLTDEEIIEIYNSDKSNRSLAAAYGVCHRTVGDIKKGIKHSWLTERNVMS